MTFRVGQKVVCVNANGADTLTKNAIYTIKCTAGYGVLSLDDTFGPGVLLNEAEPNQGDSGFDSRRFRPVVERKTSIELFHQIRRDVENNVPAELVGERA